MSRRTPSPDLQFEKQLLGDSSHYLVGLDEVGRGALAGPVSVGAVVIRTNTGPAPAGLQDSKKLSPQARQRLVEPLRMWAPEWSVGHASPAEIDAHGISVALHLAAIRALAQLKCPVDIVLLDGTVDFVSAQCSAAVTLREQIYDVRLGDTTDQTLPAGDGDGDWDGMEYVIPDFLVELRARADATCASVAAASVLAKTTRDAYMIERANHYPGFGFASHKGYGTAQHLSALRQIGPSELHRQSWRLPQVQSQ